MRIVKIVVLLIVVLLIIVGCATFNKDRNKENVNQIEKGKSELKIKQNEDDKNLLSNDRKKCYEIWQVCNDEFYSFINFLKEKNYSQAKYLVTDNIEFHKDEIINNAYINGEGIKLGDFNFGKQRYYEISNDDTAFDTGYEVIKNDESYIAECHVKFVKRGDNWYIDFIDIDVG